MDKTIVINLSGHAEPYRLQQDAYDRLAGYLDRAAARLRADPDRAEVLGDLERSVGDKLAALLGAGDRVVSATVIDGVLEQIGAVETGQEPTTEDDDARPRNRRRLRRIREGQQLAGVCNGLSSYAEIRVDWVRTLFVIGTVATAGILAVVYVALAFMLPVDATRTSQDLEGR